MKNVVLLAAAVLLAPVSAIAADLNQADATCVFVGMRMSQSPDERTRGVSIGTIMYFLGKIDGRAPKYDLTAHLIEIQGHMSQDLLVSEAKRCELEIGNRATVINTIGHDLAAAAAAHPPAGQVTPPAAAPGTAPPPATMP